MSDKEMVLTAVQRLPEETPLDAIIEHMKLLAAIRRGEDAADSGRVVPHEEVERRLELWLTE